ncbi:hypothetical protein [Spirosoma sp. KUDC1026]|uniref:hypothetical protein n=1 Tax=Spirosoma sp. KUDC1026 TaxID=2745947 RepID=UPI00159BE8C3|nr:hypothetical protein [Spirosoma sp. KUDC1026]QKZ13926.1 hypothetical protein HU175_15330 [Spirosoma sp. KUDC1026]
MFTLFLRHNDYLEGEPQIVLPFMPTANDWLEIPVDVRQNFWPGCAETLYVAEREHLFDEKMQYYGTRLYLQDWEGK